MGLTTPITDADLRNMTRAELLALRLRINELLQEKLNGAWAAAQT